MIAKGKSVGAGTQRERDYLDAFGASCTPTSTRSTIAPASSPMRNAMEQLAQRYPERRRGADSLRPCAQYLGLARRQDLCQPDQGGGDPASRSPKRQPQHPGIAHYLIHLYDYPSIARERPRCGQALRQNCRPRPPHAQHMPSHIFTRVGYWDDLIASNIEAARAAKSSPGDFRRSAALHGLPRSMPICSLDGTHKAKALLDEMTGDHGSPHRDIPVGPYALAAPAGTLCDRTRRLASPRRNFPVRPSPLASGTGDHAILHAHSGRLASASLRAAQADIAKLGRTTGQIASSQGRLLVAAGRY